MIHIQCTREELATKLGGLVTQKNELLYRGLGEKAERDYRQKGYLLPYEGCLAVGKGVFFTNDLGTALTYAETGIIIVTAREQLDPSTQVVDTRLAGHDLKARERLEARIGCGKYDGYALWDEVLKEDTITSDYPHPDKYIYTRRRAVQPEEIIAEVRVIESVQQIA